MSIPVARDSTVRSHYQLVERVIEAMRNHLDEPLSVRSMAKIALASRHHFNRTFRKLTGVPPSQFLYALRLERAKHLLMEGRFELHVLAHVRHAARLVAYFENRRRPARTPAQQRKTRFPRYSCGYLSF